MSNLIKNELTKIFKKKGIYITLLVVLAFIILTNCIYKYFYNDDVSSYYYSEDYIEYAKQDISKLDPNKPSDTAKYIELKTQIDIYDIIRKYDSKSWQREVGGNEIATYVNEKNTYLYGENKDEKKAHDVQNKIDETIKKLDENDWEYFATKELERAQENVKNIEEQQKNTDNKQQLEILEEDVKLAKIDLQVARYRVEKQIKYGNNYLNTALNEYQNESKNIEQMKKSEAEMSYKIKKEYRQSIENKEISKYIIENNQDINKTDDIREILKDFFSQYGLFIIVMVVMIAGTIVSEEFSKGTIKLLLIKPYDRNKILLSKFITVFIMIAFSIIAVLGMELIVGGIIFGYDSLSVPVIQYDFNTNTLVSMNIFAYVAIKLLLQLPIIILLATLAFAFSTIFTNSAIAVALPLLGYMGSSVINLLIVQYNVKFMRFFVTPNWDFSEYLFGKLPMMEGLTANFSAIVCVVYFLVMIIPTFIIFKRKNIKNI